VRSEIQLLNSKGPALLAVLFAFLTSLIFANEKHDGYPSLSDRARPLNSAPSPAVAGRSPMINNAQLASTASAGPQPIILSYSTYLPLSTGVQQDLETAYASVDSSGAACVTDGIRLWVYDAAGTPTLIVASLDSAGLIGGGVFRDEHGNCFVAGTGLTPAPGDTVFGLARFAVAKFSPTGMRAFTTFFGGSSVVVTDTIGGMTVDPLGNIYVVGTTSSADFPTHNALQNLLQGATSAFVLKLDPSGSTLVYSTFFGNNTGITGQAGVAADAPGDAFIVGRIGDTGVGGGSITTTPGAFQTFPKSAKSPFIAKLSPDGTLAYGTYLGGTLIGGDFENAIAVDGVGNAYAVGSACSSDFPTTPGAYQTTLTGCNGVASKLAADGSTLVYSTFLGGGNALDGIALDINGTAYVKGSTGGSSSFPLVNPIQSDVPQATLTAIDSVGAALLFSTFFGGDIGLDSRGNPYSTTVHSLGIDIAGNVYISGRTSIKGFPILAANNGVLEEGLRCSGLDGCLTRGFVAKISPASGTALASPSGVNLGLQPLSTGLATQSSLFIASVGTTNIQVSSVTVTDDYSIASNTCSGALVSALHCEVVVNFKPTAGGTRTGMLTITSDAPDSPRNIQLTGVGGVPQVSLSPASLALTSPSIGASGPTQTVTLSNTGQDVLNIRGIVVTGASAADFSETHNCPGQLSVSGTSLPSSCQINLSYKANTSNTESAALQITDDAAGSPHTVSLTGVVSALGLALAPGAPSALSISAGQTATYNLVVGGPGFTGSVSLSCSGSPPAASCSIPSSVNIGSTPTPFQLAVTTTARSIATNFPALRDKGGLQTTMAWAISGFGVLGISLVSRRGRRKFLLLGCALFCTIVMASCGGSGSTSTPPPPPVPTGTPAGAYTLTVTASNGAGLTQSMNLTLNVN
jgi:hypothetical protein